jgi:hypothetical protein
MKNKLIYGAIVVICLISMSTVSKANSVMGNDTIKVSKIQIEREDTLAQGDNFSEIESDLDSMNEKKHNSDTTRIRIGKMKIAVIEDGKNIIIDKEDWDEEDDMDEDWTWNEEDSDHKECKSNRFNPHWAGFAMGLNNYATSEFSTSLPPEYRYLDLNTNISYQVDLNLADVGLNIVKQRVGLVTGIGFRWNNYKFSNTNLVLSKGPDSLMHSYDSTKNYSKSKLAITYLIIPALIEFQIPTHGEDLYLAVGVEGILKLDAHSKNKNESGYKVKNNSDFYITPYSWDLTARMGYGNFGIYADYHMKPLFKENEGPELYPFCVGVSLNF